MLAMLRLPLNPNEKYGRFYAGGGVTWWAPHYWVALVDPAAWSGALVVRAMKQRDGPRSRKPASLPVLVLDQCNRLLKQHSEQGEAGRRRARGAMVRSQGLSGGSALFHATRDGAVRGRAHGFCLLRPSL